MQARQLLIDCDVLVYQSAFGAQKTRYTVTSEEHGIDATFENAKERDEFLLSKELTKDDVTVTPWLDVLEERIAIAIAENNLQHIYEQCNTTRSHLFLTGQGNYREQVAMTKPYKGNREAPKPVHYAAVKEYYIEYHNARIITGQEADDAIGIAACKYESSVICTIDKDLNMIPGRHYNWNDDSKYKVGPEDALRFFLQQLLTGDTTDNIPGLKGFGPAKAVKALSDCPSVADKWLRVKDLYKDAGHELDYLVEQGQLLWIRRKEDEVWTPDYFDTIIQELQP